MIITDSEIKKYKLNPKMLGAKVSWHNIKKGGYYVCPKCHLILRKWEGPIKDGKLPTCKSCKTIEDVVEINGKGETKATQRLIPVVSVLKYRQPTGVIVAEATVKNADITSTHSTELHRRKDDHGSKDVQMQIMLGRLSKAIELGVEKYKSPTLQERKNRGEI